eukprot:2099698-Lingulodinium_polyedra.AAC.1
MALELADSGVVPPGPTTSVGDNLGGGPPVVCQHRAIAGSGAPRGLGWPTGARRLPPQAAALASREAT